MRERGGEEGRLHQTISKVIFIASNNIEIFFLPKLDVFESNIFCRIGATEGGIVSKYSKVLTVLRQLADRHLADTTFGRHKIWPTRHLADKHLADLIFRRDEIWPT